jgi:hypothetical protein
MAFPITITKKKPLTDSSGFLQSKAGFFEQLHQQLASEGITINQDDNGLRFEGAIFRFAWNGYHLLNPVRKGKVYLVEEDDETFLRFELNFAEMFIIALLFMLLPAAMVFDPEMAVFVALVIWVPFYLGTMLLAYIRFNRLINKLLAKHYKAEE